MDFLFDPTRVERTLTALPAIAGQLPAAPSDEGATAAAEPRGVRKSSREIYRLLGNADMSHLRPALLAIENVIHGGVELPEPFSAKKHDQFSSHLTEAIAADHFLLRGFAVTKIPRQHKRTADFAISDGTLDVTIEIYSPREWDAIADWEMALWDSVKNLDVPQVFSASVNTRTAPGTDPWTVARALRHTGQSVLAEIEADLLGAVRSAGSVFEKTYNHDPYALTTEVELEVRAPGGVPRTVHLPRRTNHHRLRARRHVQSHREAQGEKESGTRTSTTRNDSVAWPTR